MRMATRKCKTCAHPDVRTIDVLIKRGEPLTSIARRFNISYRSIEWHYKSDHHKKVAIVRDTAVVKRREETGDIDAVKELMDVVNEARRRYFILTEEEDVDNIHDRHTTQCLDLWRKASIDYLEKVAKIQNKPEIQVSVVMPVLIHIVNQLEPKLRKTVYDALKKMEKQGKIYDVKIEDIPAE